MVDLQQISGGQSVGVPTCLLCSSVKTSCCQSEVCEIVCFHTLAVIAEHVP